MADEKNYISILELPKEDGTYVEYEIDANYVGGLKSDDLISLINSAMVFRGTLSSDSKNSPTITALPVPTKDIVGDVYKVISDGTYNFVEAKNGDMFIGASKKIDSDNFEYSWILVPAGDEFTIFKGANDNEDGTSGVVPAPAKGNQNKFLKADGTWATPEDDDNVEAGIGTLSVQQSSDPAAVSNGTFVFSGENPNAEALDNSLKTNQTYGAIGNFAVSFGGKSSAQGKRSLAEGTTTIAKGRYSHAEGNNSVTLGDNSHAEGKMTVSKGENSHAEGRNTQAIGEHSHSEGESTIATGWASHAEGYLVEAKGNRSHAEGDIEREHTDTYKREVTINNTKMSFDPIAQGAVSHREGRNTTAYGNFSHAEGFGTIAYGSITHAEGYNTTATIEGAHAEGAYTEANGEASHAEGNATFAFGKASHTEGYDTMASGEYSHAEGYNTFAVGNRSHAEGSDTIANGHYSHAEGYSTKAIGEYSHAEGYDTEANIRSHAEGHTTKATGENSHAEGYTTTAEGKNSHAEGNTTFATGGASHAEGELTKATIDYAHAEGYKSEANNTSAHAEGYDTRANGVYSHAEGYCVIATGSRSHAEGDVEPNASNYKRQISNNVIVDCDAKGAYSHREGRNTTSYGNGSHAEGNGSVAYGSSSHAEGYNTEAIGTCSHAEGEATKASGLRAHAEGSNTTASGDYSHAAGLGTIASGDAQTVVGRYNIPDSEALFIVGGGSSQNDQNNILKVSNNDIENIVSLNFASNYGTAANLNIGDNIFITDSSYSNFNRGIGIGGTSIYDSKIFLGLEPNSDTSNLDGLLSIKDSTGTKATTIRNNTITTGSIKSNNLETQNIKLSSVTNEATSTNSFITINAASSMDNKQYFFKRNMSTGLLFIHGKIYPDGVSNSNSAYSFSDIFFSKDMSTVLSTKYVYKNIIGYKHSDTTFAVFNVRVDSRGIFIRNLSDLNMKLSKIEISVDTLIS